MASLPTVAIIGRPNTGKSTLFNRLVGRRKAIESEIAGTTRDHIAGRIEGELVDYLLIDTGGIGGGTDDKELEEDVHRQSLLALEQADVIVCAVDSRSPLTSKDLEMASLLRRSKRRHVPIIVALTKCDNPGEVDTVLPPFYELNLGDDLIPISAPHKLGIDDLKQTIEARLRELNFEKPAPIESTEEKPPQLAIIGKPNVGKSSIVNAFMSDTQRSKSPLLVSEIAGTTRDTTDTLIRHEGKEYLLMDTAGIKRQRATKGNDIETFAYFRSIRAVEECDIAVLVLDANEPVSKQDKRIAGLALEEGKGLVILLNKIDTLKKDERIEATAAVRQSLAFCRYAPIVPCSANTREGIAKLFEHIEMVQRNRTRRLTTKDLHRWFENTIHGQPLGALGTAKHITQADEVPPTFVVFVRNPKQVQVSQLRYLENRLRETFAFEGTPVKWITKNPSREETARRKKS